MPDPEATMVISLVAPNTRSHRTSVKPLVRGNTVVGATAALGAVVTGSLLAVDSGSTHNIANAAETNVTPLDLANSAQPLALQPASAHGPAHEASSESFFDSGPVSAVMLPVASERAYSDNQRDVEMLHKADKLATQAAAVHAAASREAILLGGGGNLNEWIGLALTKMNMSQSYAPGLRRVIMAESRGNPRAVNRSDSNARAGRPSQGLMQTIPSTFRTYVLPELAHLPITNPVANITAGVRYMIANYGLGTLLNGGRSDGSGNYLGY